MNLFEAWGASHRLSTAIGNLSFLRVLGQVAARCDSQLTFSATRNSSIVLRLCRFCKIKAIDNIVKGFKYLATCQTLCNVKTSLEPASYNLQESSYYSFRCFSFPSADYAHDIPNMYGKAAAQVLSVLSVVQKRSNLYSNAIEPAGPMLAQLDLETDPLSN